MNVIKRLLWFFLAGFVIVAGGAVAMFIAATAYEKALNERREKSAPNPLNYQAPKPAEVVVSDLTFLEITNAGGVQGKITNHTKRKLNSFNANVSFMRKNSLLYRCNETVLVDVEPGASSRFQLLCEKVDRRALTSEMEPKLSLVWVYPSRDE